MPRRETLAKLRDAAPAVLPSMLLCDFANLRDEVDRLHAAGITALHLDVMDGHFVPNLTYGLPLVEAFRKLTELPLDVHLMIENPLVFAEHFARAGADSLTVHIEAVPDPRDTLRRIRDLDLAAGLALNPDTPLERIEPFLSQCDLVLVMSVMPGFGGQKFERVALEKLAALQGRIGDGCLLEVDGGVNDKTIADCAKAGANLFVVGSAIFRTNDYGPSVVRLNSLMRDNS
jgi:ribulose-phosphate 3-epimerase